MPRIKRKTVARAIDELEKAGEKINIYGNNAGIATFIPLLGQPPLV